MKKIYLLLPFFALTSCSTVEQDTSDMDNPVLVTKMVQNGDNYTFTYNGTKITEIKNTTNNTKKTFTYTDDLITRYVETYADNSTQTTDITYNTNNKMTKKISSYQGVTYTSNYIYVTDNQMKIIDSQVTATTSKTYTRVADINSDGSIKSWTETVSNTQPSGTTNGTGTLQVVTYDGGSSPFKNITGYLKILDSGEMTGSPRNILKYRYTMQYGTSTTPSEYKVFQSTYEYNENGYPKKNLRDFSDPNGAAVSARVTTYEYNHL